MRPFWSDFRGAMLRVIPACFTQAQAVAFNLFLSFFPLLLLAIGVLESSDRLKEAVSDLPSRLQFLPPGSGPLIEQFLERSHTRPGAPIALGLAGIFLVGTQVMMGLMEGFRIAARDVEQPRFWKRYLRALALLSLTILPWLATVVFTVFARQVRDWIIHQMGWRVLVKAVWLVLYYGGTFAIGLLVLIVVYRVSQPIYKWPEVVPGAVLTTILWWTVNAGFGFYYTHMPYSLVYGSLAVVIGLMVWMYFTALVLMIGAAFNAEAVTRAARESFEERATTPIISAFRMFTGPRRAVRR